MRVEILELSINPTRRRIATLSIKYYDLVLRCELVVHHATKSPWVRMPERWFNPDQKFQYCYWLDVDHSNNFQKVVLKLIFDRYNLDAHKIIELHENAKRNSVVKTCEVNHN